MAVMLLGAWGMNSKQVMASNAGDDLYKQQVEKYVAEMQQKPEDNKIFAQKLINAEVVNEPFIIYHVGKKQQDKVYYYPISDENGAIQFMVEAIIMNGVAECNLSDNLVELINLVDYKNGMIVYKDEGTIYVETPTTSLNAYYYYNVPQERMLYSEESKWDADYTEKKAVIEKAETNMVEYSPIKIDNETTYSNMRIGGDLSLTNPMGQYGYGMCWASCVATVHNYLRSTIITGFEVCTRMGIGYDEGASIYDEQDALAIYNIDYDSLRWSALTWSQLKENIDAEKPIIANGALTEEIGHAVTIYGYSGISTSDSNVKIWNPNANNGSGGYSTFKFSSGCFADEGSVYSWCSTLSYQ